MNKTAKGSVKAILFAIEAFIFSQLTDISLKASFLALSLIILQCVIYHIQDS